MYHQPPVWRTAKYFILVADDFAELAMAEVSYQKEGEERKMAKDPLQIVRRRGIYGFSNREEADKFLRRANAGSEMENAYDVS